MKKFAFVVMSIVMVVSLCCALWADDEDEHPIPSPIDPLLKSGTIGRSIEGGNGNIIQPLEDREEAPSPEHDSTEDRTSSTSQGWCSDAQYRITKWSNKGDTLTLEVESKNGEEAAPVTGVKGKLENERKVNLRGQMPIQFTVPNWVEVVHLWKDKGYNYKITKDGKLKALPVKGNGRMAYPGDTVLVKNGDTMTVWLLQ